MAENGSDQDRKFKSISVEGIAVNIEHSLKSILLNKKEDSLAQKVWDWFFPNQITFLHENGRLPSFKRLLLGIEKFFIEEDVEDMDDVIEAVIKATSWHGKWNLLAIAAANDGVFMYNPDSSSWSVPLFHELQQQINCIEWSPVRMDVLAVGCKTGICLWKCKLEMKHSSLKSAFTSLQLYGSQMSLLCTPNHYEITDLAWHPDGRFLVSCSLLKGNVCIWDVCNESCTTLISSTPFFTRWNLSPIHIKFSHDGLFLCASFQESKLSIFSTFDWHLRKEVKLSQWVRNFVWMNDSKGLLFTMEDDNRIFYSSAHSIIDFQDPIVIEEIEVCELSGEYENIITGGNIDLIEVDDCGKYLVVSFKESTSNFLALYEICNLQLKKLGFIHSKEQPFSMEFSKNSILALASMDGSIDFIPFQ